MDTAVRTVLSPLIASRLRDLCLDYRLSTHLRAKSRLSVRLMYIKLDYKIFFRFNDSPSMLATNYDDAH